MSIKIGYNRVEMIKLKDGTQVPYLENKSGTVLWTAAQPCSIDDRNLSPELGLEDIWSTKDGSLDPGSIFWDEEGRHIDDMDTRVGDQLSFGTNVTPPAGYKYSTDQDTVPYFPNSTYYFNPRIILYKYPDNIDVALYLDNYCMDPNTEMGEAYYYTYFKFYNPNDYDVFISYTYNWLNQDGYVTTDSSSSSLSMEEIDANHYSNGGWKIISRSSSPQKCLGLKVNFDVIRPTNDQNPTKQNSVYNKEWKSSHYDYWLSEPESTETIE